MTKCTKPNCDCAEKETQRLGTEEIKNYPCLKADILSEQEHANPSHSPTIKEGEQQEETVALEVKIEIYEQEIRELNYGELCVKFAKKGFRDGANWQKNQQPKGEQPEPYDSEVTPFVCPKCGWYHDADCTPSMETKERGEQESLANDLKTCNEAYEKLSGYCKWQKEQRTALKAEIEELKEERDALKAKLKFKQEQLNQVKMDVQSYKNRNIRLDKKLTETEIQLEQVELERDKLRGY